MKKNSKQGAAKNTAAQFTQVNGHGQAAWTKPVLKSQVVDHANRLVIYYPETIGLNKSGDYWEIDVIFMDEKSVSDAKPEKIALNDIVLAKSQRHELKNHDRYQEAMAAYEPIINLAGIGNYALTSPSSIASDEFVASVYEPNQLVRCMFDAITHETDNESISFYEISIVYVNMTTKVHAISLDKLILSDEQIIRVRNINYQAYRWYKHQHKLCTKNVCTREY